MQFGRIAAAIAVVLALAPVSNAVGFMGPRHASLAEQTLTHEAKEMPTTKHDKDAGGDYNKGSPLYEKQEARKKAGKDAKPASAQLSDEGLVTVPTSDKAADPKHWYTAYGDMTREPQKYWKVGLSYFLSYVIFWVLLGVMWIKCCTKGALYRWAESHDDRPNNYQDFNHHLFSLEHTSEHHFVVCCCSFCCIPLRLADTYSKLPIPLSTNFWAALVFFACLLGLGPITAGWSSVVFLCVAVYFRQRIRRKYGLEHGGMTWCGDFVRWFFCPCCTIAQEARQLDFVDPRPKDRPEGFKVAQ